MFTFAIAVAAISMASCGGKTTATSDPDTLAVENVAEAEETPSEAAQGIVVLLQEQLKNADAEQIKAIGATVAEKVAEFIAKGDEKAAQTYTTVINNFISENAEKLKEIGAASTISDALATVVNLPAGISEAAKKAAEGTGTEVDAQVEAAKQQVEAAKAAVEAAPEAVKDAVKAKAEEAAEAAKQQANEAANKAIDDAAAAAKKKLGL